jgi:hypothetical protein
MRFNSCADGLRIESYFIGRSCKYVKIIIIIIIITIIIIIIILSTLNSPDITSKFRTVPIFVYVDLGTICHEYCVGIFIIFVQIFYARVPSSSFQLLLSD